MSIIHSLQRFMAEGSNGAGLILTSLAEFHTEGEAANMNAWVYCLFGAAAVVLIYLLYSRGIAVTKSIAAVVFVFRIGKRGDRAKLNSCTGWVRHMVRFQESRTYTFVLDSQLTKGEAAVSLLDRDKRELLRLDRQQSAGSAELERTGKYHLRWDFKGATGTCALHW